MRGPMRSLLGFIVFTAVFIGLLAAVLVPIVVPPLVTAAVRQALPFEGGPVDVAVDVDVLELARGSVRGIRVSGHDLAAGPDVHVGTLEVSVADIRLDRRGFAAIEGGASSVALTLADGTALTIDSLQVSGPSTDVRASATISATQTLQLVQARLADAGINPPRIELVDGGVALDVLGQPVQAALRIEDGALVIASFFGGGPIVLLGPEPGDPWRLVSADVSPAGVSLDAAVDAGAVLESR
jgi:hypothetical protein